MSDHEQDSDGSFQDTQENGPDRQRLFEALSDASRTFRTRTQDPTAYQDALETVSVIMQAAFPNVKADQILFALASPIMSATLSQDSDTPLRFVLNSIMAPTLLAFGTIATSVYGSRASLGLELGSLALATGAAMELALIAGSDIPVPIVEPAVLASHALILLACSPRARSFCRDRLRAAKSLLDGRPGPEADQLKNKED